MLSEEEFLKQKEYYMFSFKIAVARQKSNSEVLFLQMQILEKIFGLSLNEIEDLYNEGISKSYIFERKKESLV